MQQIRILSTLVILVFFCNLCLAQPKQAKLLISKVKLDRKVFDPSAKETVKLSFEVNKAVKCEVVIYNILGGAVREFEIPYAVAGERSVVWDGRDNNNQLISGKMFLYVIHAIADKDEKAAYNPSDKTGGELIKTHEYTFDNASGKIEFVLPKACMVRLRAGLRDGMLVRTIYDWEPFPAGRHNLQWNGSDESGCFNLAGNKDVQLNLTCYTLPDNTIIIKGNTVLVWNSSRTEISGSNKKDNVPWNRKGKFLHYTHDPMHCHEPCFEISFQKHKSSGENDIPIIKGEVPVRIKIDDSDAEYMTNKRFEVMLYVDGVFLYEIEEGTSPFTFNWNTKGLTKGTHIFTAIIMSYDDHIGTLSKKIIIGD